MLHTVLQAYGLDEKLVQVASYGSGLINHTWKVTVPGAAYILQRVNSSVFAEPRKIAFNISLLADHLKRHHPGYPFVAPLPSLQGGELVFLEGEGYFRLFPFMEGSHTIDVVETPDQAYEAALQFGRFTRLLSGLDAQRLEVTIPFFHDLGLRYRQFLTALERGNGQRIRACGTLIAAVQAQAGIVQDYQRLQADPDFRLRVTHHDTKISNVLFDARDKGICVIDLDTVMPGYFISDLGDMLRTYLSPVSEEEPDVDKIEVRAAYYRAIVEGYFGQLQSALTETEKGRVFYAGKFMVYMQALRFLTDHISNDVYYGARYEGHNLVRARNQMVLLQRLLEQEPVLSRIRW